MSGRPRRSITCWAVTRIGGAMKRGVVWFSTAALLLTLWCYVASATEPDATESLIVVPPDAGVQSWPGEWKLRGTQSDAGYSVVEIKATTLPKGPRPAHVHTREDEAWYVIEGELSFRVGDQAATAGPGTFVFARRNVPHTYRITKVPARYLLIASSAGLEGLFAEVAELRKRFTGPTGEFSPSVEFENEFQKLRATFRSKYGTYDAELPSAKTP
jgi:mannose-6-phosphate isomerase-like protein (cupin superfamily)